MRSLGIFVISMAILRVINGYNFTELEEPTGIFIIKSYDTYIAYNDWKMYYYIDLGEFYNNIELLGECVNSMTSFCANSTSYKGCNILTDRYENHLGNLKFELEFLEENHKVNFRTRRNRRTRGLFDGAPFGFMNTYLYKPLFGFLDERDGRIISEKINEIRNRTEEHIMYEKEELSLIQQSVRVNNMSISNMKESLIEFSEEIRKVFTIHNDNYQQLLQINYITNLATNIIQGQENMLERLKNILQNTINGNLRDLITVDQIRKNILEISMTLDEHNMLLTQNNLDFQTILSIKAGLVDKKLMVEVVVPVVNRDTYKLTKVTTLPVTINNQTIFVDTENRNYLINDEIYEYIPISDSELQKCKKLAGDKLICSPQTEAYIRDENICESKILFGGEINNILRKCNYKHVKNANYIKHLDENTYYIFTTGVLNIIEKCPHEEPSASVISKIGILKMSPNCEIRLDGIKISSRNTKTYENITTIESPYQFSKISPGNLKFLETKGQDVKLPKLSFIDYDKDFQRLIDTAEDIKIKFNNMTKIDPIELPQGSLSIPGIFSGLENVGSTIWETIANWFRTIWIVLIGIVVLIGTCLIFRIVDCLKYLKCLGHCKHLKILFPSFLFKRRKNETDCEATTDNSDDEHPMSAIKHGDS